MPNQLMTTISDFRSQNLTKATQLIAALIELVPEPLLVDAVVFGSAAIVLQGIDLERPISDLDLFVAEPAYAKLKAEAVCEEVEKKPGVYALQINGLEDVEILKGFPGVEHSQVLKRATVLPDSCGLLVASLEDLGSWKAAQGREKDLADLACMDSEESRNGRALSDTQGFISGLPGTPAASAT